ncbi:hypothetical protein Golax_008926, partial [Gossypium laxum]|nr:hypothetical protein [Gossypium laxum]
MKILLDGHIVEAGAPEETQDITNKQNSRRDSVHIGCYKKDLGLLKTQSGNWRGSFRDPRGNCSAAKEVWTQVISVNHHGTFFSTNLHSCRGKEYISVHEDIRSSYQENSPGWGSGFLGIIHVGKCSEFDAELWGSLDGLVLLQQQGYNKIMIHSDSLQVIKGIYDSSLVDSNSALIRRIHQILLKVDHWRIKHVSREKNRVVDCLAKMLLNKKDD